MGKNYFADWTPQMIAEHNARIARITRKPNHAGTVPYVCLDPDPVKASAQPQVQDGESTDVRKLNKTERAFYEVLKRQGHIHISVQAVTLKLADDCRFTVDFVVKTITGQLIGYEVKGFFRDDAKVKVKVAARMYRHVLKFVLVRWIKGAWEFEEVKP